MEEKINKKIKICFFSPASAAFFSPYLNINHGGAELQMYLTAKKISENHNFDISFLVEEKNNNSETENIKLYKSINLKKKESVISKIPKAIKLLIQLKKINPDIVISTNANALTGFFALYAKIFNKKYIFRSSSLADINYPLQNGISGKIYRYGLKNASAVTVQTQEIKSLMKKHHNIDAVIIKNLFEIKQPPATTNKEFILWVSRFDKTKNPELFLNLAKKIPAEKFVMICPYAEQEKKDWNKLKKKADKIPNLKFTEKVHYAGIQKYFDKAVLFVNTSDFEGFPNTFLQSAQAKTPAASLKVNPDNFITEYNCGIFAEGNFEKLSLQIKNLLNNKDELKTKGENIYRYLKANHDINIAGEHFKQLIEKII
ncbi:MAG: glycosyltransferase family 4 protein [Chlorobi bacterium]|nr:glycosyltransferase family 4 protein [Chlorobiota bacterium]